MKSTVSLGLCCILFSIITTTYGQPPFRSFPRFVPPRIIRGFPGPPGFGRFEFRPPIGRPAFIGEEIFGPPLVGGPGIRSGPIFAAQPNNPIFNGNPFVPPFSPVNVLNNGLQGNVGFPTNTIIQGNSIANSGIPPTFATGNQNTGNVGTTTNTIGNVPFGTTNAGPSTVITQGTAPTTGIQGTGLPLNVNSGFPATVNTGFPANVNSGFPATLNTGFPATINSAFPGPIPNTAFPGSGPGFFGTINTGIPATLPNAGNVVPGTTNVVGGTNTLTGSGFTTGTGTGTGTLTNQFLLNNGVPALAQVNSMGTQVTSNTQTDGNQDNMVLAAGNTFANRFTVTGEGASQAGFLGGETGDATFQDPTSGQTISGNTLVNTGSDTAVPVVDTSGAAVQTTGTQGTDISPDVAVIGTIGMTDTGAVDPNTLPTTAVGSKCQATGCSADQQCVFAGEYPCAMYLESLECRCQAGCRVMNFFIPEGQSRQVDSCGNICSCDQTGENKGTARCTTINCPQQ